MWFRKARLAACAAGLALASCSTHYVRRAPEPERASFLAYEAIQPGMSVPDVIRTMLDVRGVGQEASLAFSRSCDPSTQVILHAGEMLAKVGHTRVYAAGFASLQVYSLASKSLRSYGFDRQGAFVAAVQARQQELLGCPEAMLSFSAATEGGCGDETLDIGFDTEGRVVSVGVVRAASVCGQ